jgi:hypothetical protein
MFSDTPGDIFFKVAQLAHFARQHVMDMFGSVVIQIAATDIAVGVPIRVFKPNGMDDRVFKLVGRDEISDRSFCLLEG